MLKKILRCFYKTRSKSLKPRREILDDIEAKILSILDFKFDYRYDDYHTRDKHTALEEWRNYDINIFLSELNRVFDLNLTEDDILGHYTVGTITNLIYFKNNSKI